MNFEASYGIFPEMELRIVEQCATLTACNVFFTITIVYDPKGTRRLRRLAVVNHIDHSKIS